MRGNELALEIDPLTAKTASTSQRPPKQTVIESVWSLADSRPIKKGKKKRKETKNNKKTILLGRSKAATRHRKHNSLSAIQTQNP